MRFQKNASSSFDSFDETNAYAEWINAHFYRMLVYSPYFDSRTSWYKRGLVYDDIYAIYTGGALAGEHPEWILRDREGTQLHILGEAAEYAADVSNPQWRSYFISALKAKLSRGTYTGTFLDDVNMWADVGTAGGERRAAINYRGEELSDEAWRSYMSKFLEEIHAALPGYEIAQNMVWFKGAPSGPGPQNPYTKSAIQQAGRVEIERGVNDSGLTGGSGTFSLSSLFSYVDEVHALGPGIIMAGGDETVPGMEYNLAAYFLVNNGKDEVVGGGSSQTPLNFWPGFEVKLGEAEGARARSAEGLFTRKFSHGLVYLNEPGASTKVITLPAEMLNTAGEKVRSVTLGAKSAAILRD